GWRRPARRHQSGRRAHRHRPAPRWQRDLRGPVRIAAVRQLPRHPHAHRRADQGAARAAMARPAVPAHPARVEQLLLRLGPRAGAGGAGGRGGGGGAGPGAGENKKPIDPAARYRVTVNNFLADGGDGFTVLREGTERSTGDTDLAALVAWFEQNSPVSPGPLDRIRRGD